MAAARAPRSFRWRATGARRKSSSPSGGGCCCWPASIAWTSLPFRRDNATTIRAVLRRRADVIAVTTLILLATIWFADVLVGVNQLYMRDMTRYYYPAKQILREIVYHGEFPYWNRYFSGGQPIAANPEHEVFYPLTWLMLLPSYNLGYSLHILVHIYIR